MRSWISVFSSMMVLILAACSQRDERQPDTKSEQQSSSSKPGPKAELATAPIPAAANANATAASAPATTPSVVMDASTATVSAASVAADTGETIKTDVQPDAGNVPSHNSVAVAKLPKSEAPNEELNTLNKAIINLWPEDETGAIGKVPLAERIGEAADHIEHLRALVSKSPNYTADKKELVEKQFERFTEALSQYGSAASDADRKTIQRTLEDALGEIEGQLR